MTIKGRPPKDDEDRVRRNAPRFGTDSVVWDGVKRGPNLPVRPDGSTWCARTRKWWLVWRTSPQSMFMTPTDWEWMLETALIHDMIWSGRKEIGGVTITQLLAELRRRVQAFGASYEDRKKLAMEIETPASRARDDLEDPVAAIAVVDYKKNLGVT